MADERDQSKNERDPFIAEVLQKWRFRFLANGVALSDMERLGERIANWSEWCEAFREVGDEYVATGERVLDREDERTAGQHFLRASMYYHFGSHYWHEDEAFREETHRKAVATYLHGGAYLNPPVQRMEAPYAEGGYEIPANLRVPEDDPDGEPGDSPLVIMLPGGDSVKEELHWYGEELIERGLATLAVDSAAQGETWYVQELIPDFYRLVSAVIDHVEDLDPEGVDTSRIGVYGVSRGGFYAPHVAANDGRVDACLGISGAFTVGPVSTRGSQMSREHFMFNCKTDSLVEADRITEALTLRDDIENLTCPSIQITGDRDTITPPAQTERIAREAPNGEYLCYEGGNHVCNNIPHVVRPQAAEWLRRQLA